MTTSSSTKATVPHWAKFAMGGMAGMGATLFCQPLDLVKMRMQVSGEGGSQRFYKNTLDAVVTILRTEGVTGIYTGLTAGLLRQAMYTTSRMGMFHSLMDHISEHGSTNVELTTKIGIGMFSGGVSAFLACPAEVAMIRMSTDAKLPIEKRRDYRNVFNALSRVAKEEGLVTCWKGVRQSVTRAMVVNGSQLASYSHAKESLAETGYFQEGVLLHFCASMISGLFTAIVSLPVDVVKTRVQRASGPTNAVKIFVSIVQKEGFFSLWKGFTPFYTCLGPHTVLCFIFLEQFNILYKSQFL